MSWWSAHTHQIQSVEMSNLPFSGYWICCSTGQLGIKQTPQKKSLEPILFVNTHNSSPRVTSTILYPHIHVKHGRRNDVWLHSSIQMLRQNASSSPNSCSCIHAPPSPRGTETISMETLPILITHLLSSGNLLFFQYTHKCSRGKTEVCSVLVQSSSSSSSG